MKVALVHDYLFEYGGAERVLEALHEIWPEAPLYTAFVDKNKLDKHWQNFSSWKIKTSWAQKIPYISQLASPLRLLALKFFESFNLRKYDLIISSSNMYEAKGILKVKSSKLKVESYNSKFKISKIQKPLHINYCHTPPRALYGYPTGRNLGKNPLILGVSKIINYFMCFQDQIAASRVDFFIANSKNTQARIKKFYNRVSIVIYPPVAFADQPLLANNKEEYFLVVSRLGWAKRVDLAIKACNQLQLPLWVVGTGSEEEDLKKMAGATIKFLGSVEDQELAKIYQNAKALIFTGLDEDFGITPVEAMSFGKPVIALAQGGVLESVVEGKTGIFFEEPTVVSLVKTLKKFQNLRFKPEDCINQARKFSKKRFKGEIIKFVEDKLKNFDF